MTPSRDFVTPANALTSANLAAGFLALLAVLDGNAVTAAVLVTAGALFDVLDGPLARRGGEDHGFGATLDSLADLVSFGVVPAMSLYLMSLHVLPGLGLAACLAYLLAGAWRLARFPLVKDRGHFVGVPIPVAGVTVMFAVLGGPDVALALTMALAASVLMISSVPFPRAVVGLRWATAVLPAVARRLPPRR